MENQNIEQKNNNQTLSDEDGDQDADQVEESSSNDENKHLENDDPSNKLPLYEELDIDTTENERNYEVN